MQIANKYPKPDAEIQKQTLAQCKAISMPAPGRLSVVAALAMASLSSGQTTEGLFLESEPFTTLPSLANGPISPMVNPATETVFYPYAPPDLTDPELFPEGIEPHPAQVLTIFPPAGAQPNKKYPTIIYCTSGAFNNLPPPTEPLGFLGRARDNGFVVITVGTVGTNSTPTASQPSSCTNGLPTGCRDMNLFYNHDPDLGDYDAWNDFNYFYGEKDLTWAVQFVKNDAAAGGAHTLTQDEFQIDTARIILAGTSTGGIYASFIAFSPNRAWGAPYGAQLNTNTKVAGLIWFEPTAWMPELQVTNPLTSAPYQGAHWPESFNASLPAFYRRSPVINTTPTEPLVLNSASRLVRDNRPRIPVFLASGDGSQVTSGFGRDANSTTLNQDEDFNRYGSTASAPFIEGDPIVYFPTGNDPGSGQPIPEFRVHDAWNVVTLTRDLRDVDETFHERYTRAFLRDDIEFNRWPASETTNNTVPSVTNPNLSVIPLLRGTYAAANAPVTGFSPSVEHPELASKALNWMNRTFCIEGQVGVYCRNLEPNVAVLVGQTFTIGSSSTITVDMTEAPEVYDAALLYGYGAAATIADNDEWILCADDGRGERLCPESCALSSECWRSTGRGRLVFSPRVGVQCRSGVPPRGRSRSAGLYPVA